MLRRIDSKKEHIAHHRRNLNELRKYNPTEPGIYIVNGKKVMIK